MRAGTADISVPASGAARQNRLVMAVAAVAALLDVISVNRKAARPLPPSSQTKLLLVLIAGAVGGTVGQKAAEDLGRAGDEHAGMRLGQALRDRAQGSGVLQAVGNGIAILPADALKGIADRGRVQAWPAAFMQSISAAGPASISVPSV